MTTEAIITLILSMAPIFGVEPKVALAVAAVESNFNQNAIGGAGEIGLFQIMPRLGEKRGYTKKQLLDPVINTYIGLLMIKDAKDNCVHKGGHQYLICYNYGAHNAKKIKHPSQFPYVRKIASKLKGLLSSSKE